MLSIQRVVPIILTLSACLPQPQPEPYHIYNPLPIPQLEQPIPQYMPQPYQQYDDTPKRKYRRKTNVATSSTPAKQCNIVTKKHLTKNNAGQPIIRTTRYEVCR